jgi:hypothetical protein
MAVALGILTLLSLICGAAWWMSALYNRVSSIDRTCANTDKRVRRMHRTFRRHQRGSDLFRNETISKLVSHDLRLAHLEGRKPLPSIPQEEDDET